MGKKIAIVDDNRSLLESLRVALGGEGFEVDTYNNGEQALRGRLLLRQFRQFGEI